MEKNAKKKFTNLSITQDQVVVNKHLKKRKEDVIMKKIVTNMKRAITVFVLTLVLVGAVSPVAQAGVDYSGKLAGSPGNYYAKTTGSGYDDRGYANNIVVYAQIKDSSTRVYVMGQGSIVANSRSWSTKAKTYHGFGIGTSKNDITDTWQKQW